MSVCISRQFCKRLFLAEVIVVAARINASLLSLGTTTGEQRKSGCGVKISIK